MRRRDRPLKMWREEMKDMIDSGVIDFIVKVK